MKGIEEVGMDELPKRAQVHPAAFVLQKLIAGSAVRIDPEEWGKRPMKIRQILYRYAAASGVSIKTVMSGGFIFVRKKVES